MRGVLLDLDGVVYVGEEALSGAAATVGWLAREGIPFRYLTNTTSRPRQVLVDKLTCSRSSTVIPRVIASR